MKKVMMALALGCTAVAAVAEEPETLVYTGSSANWSSAGNVFTNTAGQATSVSVHRDARLLFDDSSAVKNVTISGGIGGLNILEVNATSDYTFTTPSKQFGQITGYFLKRGTGKVVFNDANTTKSRLFENGLGRGFYVEEGSAQLTADQDGLLSVAATDANCTLSVKDGATLQIGGSYPTGTAVLAGDGTKMAVAVTNGTLKMDFASNFAFGPLSLYNAVFDYSEANGMAAGNGVGIFTFCGKVTLDGDTPYAWTLDKAQDTSRESVNLWDSPLTEFCVADITDDETADFTLGLCVQDRCLSHATKATRASGFRKTGPGAMLLTNGANAFSGDVVVEEGTLYTATDNRKNRVDCYEKTYLGLMTNDARTITVKTNATLVMYGTYPTGVSVKPITNDTLKGTFVLDGGKLDTANEIQTVLPNLTVANGAEIGGRTSPLALTGRMMVQDKIRVTGTVPFVWNALSRRQYTYAWNALALNGYPENTFEVENVTGDAEADATFDVPFCISSTFFAEGYTEDDWRFGFTKTGAGTMRLTAEAIAYAAYTNATGDVFHTRTYNGDTKVEEGTLQVDGDISLSDTVRVAAGALLAGTGSVNNVSVSAGGGFRATKDRADVLKVKGNLELAGGVVIDLIGPAFDETKSYKADILEVTGTITGAENLRTATVRVNGEPAAGFGVAFDGKRLKAKYVRGFMLILR